jgi:DHHC palmitoyltransferase
MIELHHQQANHTTTSKDADTAAFRSETGGSDGTASSAKVAAASLRRGCEETRGNGSALVGDHREPARWLVHARYAALSTTAVLLTLACPGGATPLSAEDNRESTTMAQLVAAVYLLTLAAFCAVHFRDPGYISSDMLEAMEDGLSLMGYDDEEGGNNNNKDSNDKVDVNNRKAVESVALKSHTVRSRKDVCSSSSTTNPNEEVHVFDPLSPPSAQLSLSNERTSNGHDKGNNDDENYFRGTRRKFCDICHFAPPLRSHHCKQCDRCVATFDHHCALVGACIGEKNHCIFWWFLLLQATGFVLCCHVVGSSRLGASTLLFHGFQWDAVRVVVAKLYLYPLCALSVFMLWLHSFFALSNMTSFECYKGPRHLDYLKGTEEMDLPFSKGCMRNLKSFCCDHYHSTQPKLWHAPGKIVRDSEDWWEHPWRNKYWSCC